MPMLNWMGLEKAVKQDKEVSLKSAAIISASAVIRTLKRRFSNRWNSSAAISRSVRRSTPRSTAFLLKSPQSSEGMFQGQPLRGSRKGR